jgi:hypothetical protein
MAAAVDNSVKLLALADTIHDMWDGYRNIDDDGASLAAIRTFLRAYLQTTNNPSAMCPVGQPAADADFITYLRSCLAGDPASSVIPSDIEDQTINHFETRGDIPSAYTTLTYSAIAAGGAALPATDVLHIVPDDAGDEKDLDAAQKKIVADFILRYIFHVPAGTPIGFNSYFTFDMGMSGVGTIFTDHPNAIRLITPQNIADSADTSTKKMGFQDNVFDFIENPAGSSSYISRRNTFSPTYNIGLQNSAFNSADPYAFSYIINGPGPAAAGGGRIQHSRSFSPSEKEGPPLDYLLKCNLDAAAGEDFSEDPLPSSSLRLVDDMPDDMVDDIVTRTSGAQEALFLDIKRDGDQSQVDAAKIADATLKSVVMVTGDRLCSLASRLERQRCIYQSKHVLKIYRFAPYSQDPAEIARYLDGQRAAEAARFLATYGWFLYALTDGQVEFITRLRAFNTQIQGASAALNATEAGPRILLARNNNRLYQIKLLDMYNDICRLIAGVENIGTNGAFAAARAAGDSVAGLRAAFNFLATGNIMKEFALDIARGMGMVPPPPPAPLPPPVVFDPTKEYPYLNYSYKQIKTLINSFNIVKNKLVDNPRPARGVTYWFDIVTAPDGYNTLLQQFSYTISDPTLLNDYRINCPTEAAGDDAAERTQVTSEISRIFDMVGIPAIVPRGGCQSGGDPSVVIMNQNRIDLFHDICATAATYVDSVFTKRYPLLVLQSMLNQIVKTGAAGDRPDLIFPLQTLIENTQKFIDANKTLTDGVAAFYATRAWPPAEQNINSVVMTAGRLLLLIAYVNAAAAGYSTETVMSGLLGELNANESTFQLIDELSLSWDQGVLEYDIAGAGTVSSILNGLYFTAKLESDVARIILEPRATDPQKLQALLDIGIPQETITAAAAAPVSPGLTKQQTIIQYIVSTFSNNYATSLVAPTLVMLAMLNDIIERNVTTQTSLYTKIFLARGALPAAVGTQVWNTDVSWQRLTDFFMNNITVVSSGQVATESLKLMAGGTRRRRRTIRKRGKSARRRRATARR